MESVPVEVQKTVKCVAYKFHELSTDIKLRKKLDEFKTLVLVLRGQDVQGQLDKIYDRQKMKFIPEVVRGLDVVDYEATPHALFLTNPPTTRPIIDFILKTQYIKLFQDLKENYCHFSNSIQFNQQMKEIGAGQAGQEVNVSKFAKIKKAEDLLDQSYEHPASSGVSAPGAVNLCSGVCVIKPNQPLNVIMRTLKSIANMNPEELAYTEPGFVQISKIESVSSYSPEQLDLLFEHDVEFDSAVSASNKPGLKEQHHELLANKPTI